MPMIGHFELHLSCNFQVDAISSHVIIRIFLHFAVFRDTLNLKASIDLRGTARARVEKKKIRVLLSFLKMSKDPKNKRYTQKFRKVWLTDIQLKEWIVQLTHLV
ncbi:uncharacterized protein LOC143905250 [Temnothorax americanus]|uniref:uncharacterized protein LOC143905250 n=1 Tax=Temnothorax americanus TaxID=1964332 RepID=UPI004067EDD5